MRGVHITLRTLPCYPILQEEILLQLKQAKYWITNVLYNRARKAAPKDDDGEGHRLPGIAFVELVVFIVDIYSSAPTSNSQLFLAKFYQVRLEQQGVTVDNRVHNTRLWNRLLNIGYLIRGLIQRDGILFRRLRRAMDQPSRLLSRTVM